MGDLTAYFFSLDIKEALCAYRQIDQTVKLQFVCRFVFCKGFHNLFRNGCLCGDIQCTPAPFCPSVGNGLADAAILCQVPYGALTDGDRIPFGILFARSQVLNCG